MSDDLKTILAEQAQEILNQHNSSEIALIFVNGSIARKQSHKFSDIDMRAYFFSPVSHTHFYKLIKRDNRPVLLNCQCISLPEIREGISNPVRWYWFYHGIKTHILLYEASQGLMDNLLQFVYKNKPNPYKTVPFIAERVGNILEKYYKLKAAYKAGDLINVVRVTENIADDTYYVLRLFTPEFPPFVTENEIFPSYLSLNNLYPEYVEDISICKKFTVKQNLYIDSLYNAGSRLAINSINLVRATELFKEKREGVEWLSELLTSPFLDEYLE
ncbi:MAG: hypothetical protein IT292_02620 [Deltaproteobacteria bacterium]|nr:hypothetical protein [Deltaproteobacteria bacterium]